MKVNTPNEKRYKFYPSRGKVFSFYVCCANDCHVALTTQPQEVLPMYEIVFGGWNSTKSVIRRNGKGPDLTEVSTPGIVNANELRGFWISWYDNLICVGRKGEDAPFMTYKDPHLFPVKYVGICTAYGSTGSWLFEDPTAIGNGDKGVIAAIENMKFVKTPNEKRYKFWPAHGGVFTFNVCCANDCHVALSSQPREDLPMYEIVFGGWNNTKSVIRQIGIDLVAAATPGIVSANELRSFWIRWHDSVIYVGRVGEDVPFMTHKDPKLFPVKYVGVCTAYGSTGSWLFDETAVVGAVPVTPNVVKGDIWSSKTLTKVNTPNEKRYIFYPARGEVFTFRVQCANDCHVALATQPQEVLPMYEIVFGGWNNTKSVIRRNGKGPDLTEVSTPGIVNANALRGFWIRWHVNVIYVGREGEDVPFMIYKDPNLFTVKYVGICTAYGSTGSWEFDDTAPIGPASPKATIVVKTTEEKTYKFYTARGGMFKFKVCCSHDCHVALSAQPLQGLPMYEAVIGGWNNSKSAIRQMGMQPPEVAETSTPGILNGDQFRGFWIRWYDNVISVGRDGEENPFMSHKDPKLFPVNYVGIYIGATGSWIIDGE